MEADNTSFYRCGGVLQYLGNEDYEIINISHLTDFNWSTYLAGAVLIMHRPCNNDHVNMIMLANRANCKIIIDYDDNLFQVNQYNPTFWFYQDMKINILKCLRMADAVWVTTEGVKNAYYKFNQNTVVIPNAHNDYLFPVAEKKSFNTNTKYVLWRGGTTHEEDLYERAHQLIDIINSNQNWTFNFWGHCFTYLEMRCGNNYIRKDPVDTLQYFESLLDYNPNVMIFPLANNEFNKCKSNISWMEATYAGAAFFGNTDLPEFNNHCINISELQAGLNENYGLLSDFNRRSWEHIKENLLLSNINQLRHNSILELL